MIRKTWKEEINYLLKSTEIKYTTVFSKNEPGTIGRN